MTHSILVFFTGFCWGVFVSMVVITVIEAWNKAGVRIRNAINKIEKETKSSRDWTY